MRLLLRRPRLGRLVVKVGAVVGAVIVVGNLALLAASAWARHSTRINEMSSMPGIDNLVAVDTKLWRGAAPTEAGYRALAAQRTSTVIDLRAEEGTEDDARLVESLGMTLVRIPIRDGQTPSTDQVHDLLAVTERSDGRVFLHCGAGVGRTGAMAAAYLVATSGTSATTALRRTLAVGPPSLEQVVFVGQLEPDRLQQPAFGIRAVSRVLDAPRRIWHRLGP